VPITFYCSDCTQKLRIDDSFAGKKVACVRCGSRQRVPEQSLPPPAGRKGSATEKPRRKPPKPERTLPELPVYTPDEPFVPAPLEPEPVPPQSAPPKPIHFSEYSIPTAPPEPPLTEFPEFKSPPLPSEAPPEPEEVDEADEVEEADEPAPDLPSAPLIEFFEIPSVSSVPSIEPEPEVESPPEPEDEWEPQPEAEPDAEREPVAAVSAPRREKPSRLAEPSLVQPARKLDLEELIDMTAMVDIVFFLLIFFLVTSMNSLDSSIPMPAPDPQKGQAREPKSIEAIEADDSYVVVRIDRNDKISVEGSDVRNERDLMFKLRDHRMGSAHPDKLLVIGHGDATHGSVVMVLDAGRDLGMDQVRLTVQDEEQ
jgi:biopolymer transport protein ExbD